MSKFGITTDSLSSAFEKVKANHGCAGVDGVTVDDFGNDLDVNIKKLQIELGNNTYRPLPLLEILVDKGNGEARALCIPTVRDRTAQKFILNIVEPVLDKEFEICSFAYRKGHSVKEAVCKINEYHEQGYSWVVEADIDKFFDNVNHGQLMSKFKQYVSEPFVQGLVQRWLKAEVWNGHKLSVPDKGIPQGSPISPILANLFLDELDEEMLEQGYKMIRYSDDFIVLCKNKEQAIEALELSKEVLERHRLELDEEDIVNFDDGFKFLGVMFVKSLIMKPFDVVKKANKVLHYPKPMDMVRYLKARSNQ